MPDIIVFTPKAELSAHKNLAAFVEVCRNELTIFQTVQWADILWDISDTVQIKGKTNRIAITFCTLESVDASDPIPFPEPFDSFAKAYIRYQQGCRPTKVVSQRVAALRALELALRQTCGSSNPCDVDAAVLNRAIQVIRERFGAATAYRVGGQLQLVGELMSAFHLLTVPTYWKSPISRTQETDRIGQEFDQRRAKMLPSQAVLDALPKAFRLAETPADTIITSVAALLVSTPSRIHEVLLLPSDCEVEENQPDGTIAYGLRWAPGKGAERMVKWVGTTMVPVVKAAITRIREVTQESRRIARWYEENPDSIYLPSDLEYLRGQKVLHIYDAACIVWGKRERRQSMIPFRWFCKNVGLPIDVRDEGSFINFKAFERVIIRQLPADFPWFNKGVGLKFSDALCVVPPLLFHSKKAATLPLIEQVVVQNMSDGLGGRKEAGSVFDRLGLIADDGSRLVVTTHQFRHWLNTLAQAGGMNQVDIAKWSGRKDINQNQAYDHSLPAEVVMDKLRSVVGTGHGVIGPLAKMPAKIPINRDEYSRLKVPSVCETDIGYCLHDYVYSGCELHADCVNCNELVCMKGDIQKTAILKSKRDDVQSRLSAVQGAGVVISNDRAAQHLRTTNERLNTLCNLMDDEDVPDGAFIQLNIPNPSRIEMAVQERNRSLSSDEEMIPLETFRHLLEK